MYMAIIERKKEISILPRQAEKIVDDVLLKYGFSSVNVLDIKNYNNIKWEGIEFNRLFEKNGYLYRFNEWEGGYPFTGVEVEKIGTLTKCNK